MIVNAKARMAELETTSTGALARNVANIRDTETIDIPMPTIPMPIVKKRDARLRETNRSQARDATIAAFTYRWKDVIKTMRRET